MAKFRKKPVVVEAVQFSRENWTELESWSGGRFHALGDRSSPDREWRPVAGHVDSLEGQMTAQIGDWIIRGVQGFYPCKPDIFAETYEPAS